jgi:hypothetical protein
MNLNRFRAPALAATVVLLISGVANAFAASPAPAQPLRVAPVTQADASGAAEPVEAVDTDTLQEGDQTTPDVAGTSEAAGQETPEAAGSEADGPGGHADAEGQNVDHQFDGEE